jgi:DNA polymerase I-like protein with 3'-5' exonuclease and polymerase domains
MECEGIKVDEERFKKVHAEKILENDARLNTIQTMLGTPLDEIPLQRNAEGKAKITSFNPNSPKQMLSLFRLLGCGRLGSTDKVATLKAKAAHPLNDVILTQTSDWKSNDKIRGTYLRDSKLWDGRLYYKLDPAGTVEGRFASKASSYWCGFQIQNIPRDDSVKQCLMADNGWLLGEGDYAQSEARCVGYMSGETKLIEVVEGPHDYHAFNASAFFGVPYDVIYSDEFHKTLDKALRDLAKRTNHGANYNMGEGVLLDTMGPKLVIEAKRKLKLPYKYSLRETTRHLLKVFDATYPRIRSDWYRSIIKSIKISKMLVSSLGWTRYFFGDPEKHKPSLNAAVAHGPANLSVTIINKCVFRIWKDQMYGDLRSIFRMKAQIHDSILFQFRADHPEVPGIIQERMRHPIEVTDCFGITRTMLIPPDMSAGKVRWSELK